MIALRARWSALLDQQHQLPTGALGQMVGARMVRQHAPETAWTIAQLDLRPCDHVLELGFGAGRALTFATQDRSRGTATGVDLSATMVQVAQRRNRSAVSAGRLRLLRADLNRLPFAGPHFDKIYSIHTLYFWPEPLQVLRELVGLLKPAGKLVVTLSTGQTKPDGERVYTKLHRTLAAQILPAIQQMDVANAALKTGPNSRQYNNLALVVQR